MGSHIGNTFKRVGLSNTGVEGCRDDDFNTRKKVLTAKLLRKGYRYHKLRTAISKFYRRHFDLLSKYNVLIDG